MTQRLILVCCLFNPNPKNKRPFLKYTIMKFFFNIPIFIIGLALMVLGARWMIVDQPWMLDQIANEERLGITFDQLFNDEINKTLPDYLKQIYRFFGLWVIIIGLFVCGFSRPVMTSDSRTRVLLLTFVGIMSYSGLALAIFWIPSSPFIYLGCIMLILHAASFYAHIRYIKPPKVIRGL